MSTTLETLIAFLSIAVILFFIFFGDNIKKNIYFNIVILMIVSCFIGYQFSNLHEQSQWYSIALIGVMGMGLINVLGRIGKRMKEE
ncbi:MAG TPA: hypothetical protein PLM27_14280 [Chitinophagales bacterium]|nr:hypothetical protein [Chitinophagales bacterium]